MTMNVTTTKRAAANRTVPWLSFELDEQFFDGYRDRVAPFGGNGLGHAVYLRTYSRDDNPRYRELTDEECPPGKLNSAEPDVYSRYRVMEDWAHTCRRVIEGMHSIELDWCLANGINYNMEKAQRSAQEAFRLLYDIKWTPPGRGIQMMGTRFVHERGVVEALQNCGFVTTAGMQAMDDPAEPFMWLMDKSMVGVGVGFDAKGANGFRIKGYSKRKTIFVVEDTRESWVEAVGTVIRNGIQGGDDPVLDVSAVRPAGTPIRGFGGTASGPQALVDCCTSIHDMLQAYADSDRGVSSTLITDIFNIIGVAVVSGNARRSAEIALGEPWDERFLDLKNPDAHGGWEGMGKERPWGWMSNNSVYVQPTSRADYYLPMAERTWKNGEPGYVWMYNVAKYERMNKVVDERDWRAVGFNPCAEQPLEPYEMCTLAELYPSRMTDLEDARLATKHGYRYAKIVTLASRGISDPKTRAVMVRNGRIGISQTGIYQFMGTRSRDELVMWVNSMYGHVDRYDALYSQWYGVPRAVRMTSVKPSGTVSQLPCITPGIHASPAGRRFLRRVNYAAGSKLALMLMACGYPVEDSKQTPGTWVVGFPVDMGEGVLGEDEVTPREQLELHALFARYWAGNSVSQTVKFDRNKTSAQDIAELLAEYDTRIKAVSFLPLEHGYEQAPYEALTTSQYDALMLGIKPFSVGGEVWGLHDKDDRFCDGDSCDLPAYRTV